MCAATRGPNVKWGAQMSNGVAGHHGPLRWRRPCFQGTWDYSGFTFSHYELPFPTRDLYRTFWAPGLIVLLRSEIPSGMCAKLRTVAVSNNRVHTPRSLCYCLFAPHIYICVLRAHPVRGEPHIQRNATGEVAGCSAGSTPSRDQASKVGDVVTPPGPWTTSGSLPMGAVSRRFAYSLHLTAQIRGQDF